MITTDNLLIKLYDTYPNFECEGVLLQDKKILNSLYNQLKKQHFFTEKQGNLLVKLFGKYCSCIPELSNEYKHLIESPCWSQKFRVINTIRKVYFEDDKKTHLIIDFTYDKNIKDKLGNLVVNNQQICKSMSATKYKMKVSENNLVKLLDEIKKENFEVDSEILDIYNNVKEIINSNLNYLNIFHPRNEKILSSVAKDINFQTQDHLLLLDRRHRFQYEYISPINDENLTFKLANRSSTQVFVNSKTYSIDEVFSSLQMLNRFPTLLIFNKQDVEESIQILQKLSNLSKKLQLANVGIYYRLDNNSDLHKKFNTTIQENKLNSNLDENTSIAGTASTFLPKFFYKTNWYPRSVISFTNNFKNNKVFTYCDSVDCIIYYNEHKPFVGKIDEIL